MATMPTALVIDDKYGFGDYFKVLLERMGVEVIVAGDGDAALEIALGGEPKVDMVILDFRMKQTDGKDLLARLKKIDPGLKILVSTVFMDDIVEMELYAMGADAVLRKPFPVPSFKNTVTGLLARK